MDVTNDDDEEDNKWRTEQPHEFNLAVSKESDTESQRPNVVIDKEN
jgi:hypothetical protein